MSERYKLPEAGRTPKFFAEIVISDVGQHLIAGGYFEAEGRGLEMLKIVESKLQEVASSTGKVLLYRFEPQDFIAKRFIQKQSGYNMRGRSYDGNPIYEKEFNP